MDLHNQLGYQLQLPESVAVVYSPIVPEPRFKAFRVSDQGMDELLRCQMDGFHFHEPIFEECTHVEVIVGGDYAVDSRVIDLRQLA